MREIYIRKMRYEEAERKLEREIHEAFMEGETIVNIIHGIGEGILKKMVHEFVRSSGFLKVYDISDWIQPNPGSTKVEILGIGKEKLKKYRR
ncbi:MAG: Smr/MutS family protein [Leptospira sp.]|nr:Smr/MutS family protein [Leptospira sp.]